MSSICLGTHQAFGIPTIKAGGGNHSYVGYYQEREDGGGWQFATKQGARAPGKWAQWGFAVPHTEADIMIHVCFALAVSEGLDSYMRSRVAVNVARMLETAGHDNLATQCLRDGIEVNPYNGELWFNLARVSGLSGGRMQKLAINADADALDRARFLSLFASKFHVSADDVDEEQAAVSDEVQANTDFSKVENEGLDISDFNKKPLGTARLDKKIADEIPGLEKGDLLLCWNHLYGQVQPGVTAPVRRRRIPQDRRKGSRETSSGEAQGTAISVAHTGHRRVLQDRSVRRRMIPVCRQQTNRSRLPPYRFLFALHRRSMCSPPTLCRWEQRLASYLARIGRSHSTGPVPVVATTARLLHAIVP